MICYLVLYNNPSKLQAFDYYIRVKLIAIKLYKKNGQEIVFWETWDIDDYNGAVNQGIVEEVGDYRVVKSDVLNLLARK